MAMPGHIASVSRDGDSNNRHLVHKPDSKSNPNYSYSQLSGEHQARPDEHSPTNHSIMSKGTHADRPEPTGLHDKTRRVPLQISAGHEQDLKLDESVLLSTLIEAASVECVCNEIRTEIKKTHIYKTDWCDCCCGPPPSDSHQSFKDQKNS